MTGSTTNRLIRYAGAGYIPWGSFWLWRVWKVRFSSWGQGDTFSWWWWLKFEMCCVMSRMWSGADDGKYVSGRGGGASHGLRPGRKPGGAWQAGVTWGGWWAGGGLEWPQVTGVTSGHWPGIQEGWAMAQPGPGDAARRSSPYVIYNQTEGLMPQSPVHCQPSDNHLDHPSPVSQSPAPSHICRHLDQVSSPLSSL